MEILKNLKYSKNHEWIRIEDNKAFVGITDYAQHSLGDIVFVELPEIDKEIKAGEVLGVIESVKAASDVYLPISGRVVEINEELSETPEKINKEPYNSWIAKVEIFDNSEINMLLDEKEYKELLDRE